MIKKKKLQQKIYYVDMGRLNFLYPKQYHTGVSQKCAIIILDMDLA